MVLSDLTTMYFNRTAVPLLTVFLLKDHRHSNNIIIRILILSLQSPWLPKGILWNVSRSHPELKGKAHPAINHLPHNITSINL